MRSAGLLSLLLSAAAPACAARVPPPAILLEPGIKISSPRVEREVLTTFQSAIGDHGLSRVMHLDFEPDGRLRVIAERTIRWLDRRDGSSTDVPLPRAMFRPAPVEMPDGSVRFAGLSGSRDVPVLTLDGRADTVIRSERYKLPVAADVTSDPGTELLIPRGFGVRIHAPSGRPLGFVARPWYASIHTVVRADADAELEIVFARQLGNSVEVQVVNDNGSIAAAWRIAHRTWLSSVPALGVDRLWGLTAAGFVSWDASGRELESYPAEGAWYLRDVTGTRAGGLLWLVASGNGYRGRSMLAAFDTCRRLVYQEVFPARTYAIAADPAGAAVVVGNHETVLRYTVDATSERFPLC